LFITFFLQLTHYRGTNVKNELMKKIMRENFIIPGNFTYPGKSLKKGSEGEHVKTIQLKLGLHEVTGIFDNSTFKAVKHWQESMGLTGDGIIGPNTWTKMFGDIAVSPNVHGETGNITMSYEEIKNKLREHLPQNILNELSICIEKYMICTSFRLSHFLGQCAHESANFTRVRENLNYSAERIMTIFPKYFKENALAKEYANNPEKLASRVYANRMGNGNEESKEGYLYCGRGYIQLTGKANYSLLSKSINRPDIMDNPDIITTSYPLTSAAWFWDRNSLNIEADKGLADKVVSNITHIVNGGNHGLADRIRHIHNYYNALSV
jgi:putative chitinase